MLPERDVISKVLACKDVPVVPAIAIQVLEIAQNPEAGAGEVARTMGHDPVLAAQVIKAANRLVPQEIADLQRAVAMLGTRSVSALALAVSLGSALNAKRAAGEALKTVWRRSLYSALGIRLILEQGREPAAHEAFLSGLLQDVGMLGMLTALGQDYADFVASVADHEDLAAAEREALGTDHAEVGAAMARAWSLPSRLAASIAAHHNPSLDDEAVLRLVRWNRTARAVANVLLGSDTEAATLAARDLLDQHFGFSTETIQGVLSALAAQAEEMAELFDVEVASAENMQSLLTQVQEVLMQVTIDAEVEARDLRSANRELTEAASRDRLTGLHNRAGLETLRDECQSPAAQAGAGLAVLFLDADHFKSINDTYGHATGDEVLVEIARRVVARCGDENAFRFGGEEFVCVVPGCDRDQAADLAESIRTAIGGQAIDTRSGAIPVTVTVGVATADGAHAGASLDELISAADKALYEGKEAGRNRVCLAPVEMPAET